MMTISTRLAGLASLMLVCASNPMKAADTTCGSRQCEEAICSSADVVKCSDWNDLGFDGWSPFPHLYRDGGAYGDVVAGKGLNGTAAWEHKIQPYFDETMFEDTGISVGTGPLYARFYAKFSPGYQFMMICGLQKQFYFMQSGGGRIMVGVTKAMDMGGTYAS